MEPLTLLPTQARLLECYEAVAQATHRMLEAARAADWHALDQGGRDCETWMRRIERLGERHLVLDARGRRQRIEILCRVLRDDAQLRDLLQPRLGQVDRYFGRHPGAAAPR